MMGRKRRKASGVWSFTFGPSSTVMSFGYWWEEWDWAEEGIHTRRCSSWKRHSWGLIREQFWEHPSGRRRQHRVRWRDRICQLPLGGAAEGRWRGGWLGYLTQLAASIKDGGMNEWMDLDKQDDESPSEEADCISDAASALFQWVIAVLTPNNDGKTKNTEACEHGWPVYIYIKSFIQLWFNGTVCDLFIEIMQ